MSCYGIPNVKLKGEISLPTLLLLSYVSLADSLGPSYLHYKKKELG